MFLRIESLSVECQRSGTREREMVKNFIGCRPLLTALARPGFSPKGGRKIAPRCGAHFGVRLSRNLAACASTDTKVGICLDVVDDEGTTCVGVYADYYFDYDDANLPVASLLLPTEFVQGWSAGVTSRVTVKIANGPRLSVGVRSAGSGVAILLSGPFAPFCKRGPGRGKTRSSQAIVQMIENGPILVPCV